MIIQQTINYLLFYFMLYSILGWLMESIYRSFIEKKIINSGFLHGPCCPIYGFGTIILILLFSKIKNPALLFMMGFTILTVWEYVVGVLMEKLFHTKYWDYSDQKININGRVCLKNSVYWGILTVLFTLIVQPFVQNTVELIPYNYIIKINIVIYVIFILDLIISIIKTSSVNKTIEKLKQLGSSKEYNKISLKLYKYLKRQVKAFPTMKSESISKFLNNKLELETIKQKIIEIKEKIRKNKKDTE